MDNMTDVPTSEIKLQPQLKRRFSFRTILLPVLFIALHFAVSLVVSIAYLVVYFVVQSVGGSVDIMAILQDQTRLTQLLNDNFPIMTSLSSLILIPICIIYLRLASRRDPRTWLTEKPRLTEMMPALAMIIGAVGAVNLWYNFLIYLQDFSQPIKQWMGEYAKSSEAFSDSSGLFWLILGVSILTPIAEELIFRGVVQGELRKAMPEWAAIAIQAVVFAAYHMQPIQSSYVLLPAVLLGLAYYWTRSIWVPIVMHCLFNFLGGVLPNIIGDNAAGQAILMYIEFGFILVAILATLYLGLNHRRKTMAEELHLQQN